MKIGKFRLSRFWVFKGKVEPGAIADSFAEVVEEVAVSEQEAGIVTEETVAEAAQEVVEEATVPEFVAEVSAWQPEAYVEEPWDDSNALSVVEAAVVGAEALLSFWNISE